MRIVRPLAITLLVVLVALLGSEGGRAQGPGVQFYGIGDVPDGPGGVGSAVRDATRVNGVIYAVGASTTTSNPTPPTLPNLDTPIMWTSSGGPNGTVTMLPPGPNFPPNTLTGTPADSITAYAITPAATFIASQIRNNSIATQTGTPWGRVTVAGMSNTLLGGPFGGFVALSLSENGTVVYGQNAPAGIRRFLRYDNGVVTAPSYATELGLDPALAWSLPIPRGTSSDGSVMVGVASVDPNGNVNNGHFNGTNGTAFRYANGVTTAIPKLLAGGWNFPIAVSPNGNLALVAGNSSEAPRGEVYLHNAQTSVITTLGSPNTAWFPRALGGMTADGSVVAVTYTDTPNANQIGQIGGLQLPVGNRFSYLHNGFGWFHLASALADREIDLEGLGWDPTAITITGMRTVDGVDLVFGQGRRRTVGVTNPTTGALGFINGAMEGFVAQFPAGYLATFKVLPTPAADTSIVGAWGLGIDPNTATLMYLFMRDGTYYQIGNLGFERGFFTWGGGSGTYKIWTLRDDDGPGISTSNGKVSRTLTISGDTITIADTNCPGCVTTTLTRVPPLAGTILGGWVLGTPTEDNHSAAGVFTGTAAGGKYFFAQDFDGFANGDGSEMGNWTLDAGTGLLTLSNITQINAGQPHAEPTNSQTAQLAADGLGLVITDSTDVFPFTRVVNPATVTPVITNANLAASGTEDSAFSYTVTGVNALTFGATGLPAGLSIDSATGVISGTPAVNGTFNVGISITNSLGDTDTDTLALTFSAPPASFHGIGDLPGGGTSSAVRDATRVDGVIYAVGASTVNALGATPNLDTPALWSSTGGVNGTLSALPNTAVFTPTQTDQKTAWGISRYATYLASQARPDSTATTSNWVRLTRSLLPGIAANLNLSNTPGTPAFAALAMSESGDVIYGIRSTAPGVNGPVRYEPGLGFNFPALPGGKTFGYPLPRGTSADGMVMVGVAASNPPSIGAVGPYFVANTVAFRYQHNAGTLTGTTTQIDLLPGGSWNMPLALTAAGDQTVVIGDSAAYPSGEVYLTDAANVVTATLGSPNTGLMPRPLGGITADGVIAMTFASGGPSFGLSQIQGLGIPTGSRYGYIHNSHGWFHFSSVLAAQGVDLVGQGWDASNFAITGVRTVEGVDLVFGQGLRRTVNAAGNGYVNGAQEGFVAELPAGTLAAFNPTPTPPADQSVVGTWLVGDGTNPSIIVNFLSDGTYVRINVNTTTPALSGFERGLYTWAGNAAGGAIVITTLYDTDGTNGGSGRNGQLGNIQMLTGDTFAFTDTHIPNVPSAPTTRLTTSPGSIVGGWMTPYPTTPNNFEAVVFTGSNAGNKYFYARQGSDQNADGMETGTYTWDPTTHLLLTVPTGGSTDTSTITASLSRDDLGLSIVETTLNGDVGTTDFTRIVSPATVPVPAFGDLQPLAGTTGLPFAYTVPVTHTRTVTAVNLPPGLGINAATGAITGTPTAAGSFTVGLTAHNTFGAATGGSLAIVVSAPAVVIVPPAPEVVVEPEVPAGTPDVTLTFNNVTGGGETTVSVIDPETTPELAPEPPGNFEIVLTDGGVPLYYDISTTATIAGPTEICFSYAGVDFGGDTPRLFHYAGGVWVDITTHVDTATQTLCGETTSFSPFAIFKSKAKFVSAGKGFHAPVNPDPTFVNTAKAGSTVPLKFNVTLDGVEKTTTTGLIFSVAQAASAVCTTAPQDQVDYVVVGETNLRYDAQGQLFIQNWKLPKTPGCVIARITYKDADQEVLILTAKFSLK